MRSRKRNSKSLRRRKPSIEPREVVLIVCEGEKTEPHYFTALRKQLGLSSIEVQVCGKECGPAPKSVVEFAKEKKAESRSSTTKVEYDAVWCVIDREAPNANPDLPGVVRMARDNNLNVALSNPCFEYWYICHFEHTGSPLANCAAAVTRLRKHFTNYSKGDPAIVEVLLPKTEIAIDNSRNILKERGYDETLIHCNPSTHVHRVVEHLLDIASKQVGTQ